jgi:hypothetical protein
MKRSRKAVEQAHEGLAKKQRGREEGFRRAAEIARRFPLRGRRVHSTVPVIWESARAQSLHYGP